MTNEVRRGWRKPRLSTRLGMLLVLVIAVVLGLGWPAWQVYREKDPHVHAAVDIRGATPSVSVMGGMESPFWPRYWRRLVGRPYRRQPLCGPTPGFEAETCEYADPSIAFRIGGQVVYHPISRQSEWMAAYEAARARKPSAR